MESRLTIENSAHIEVENVGGIDRAEVSFAPGVTVLVGRNATNRTSLLQAIKAACGSDDFTIKGDADEAHVELTIGDETYTRSARRIDGGLHTSGTPYLDDPVLADLFSFLLESNEARRAVVRDEDLRDLIMRPVETDVIEAEIERLQRERRDVEDELDELDALKGKLPSLEEERSRLEQRIADKRSELESVEADIESLDADLQETREEKAAFEDRLADLRELRSSLEDVRYDLDTERETLEELREERRELREERRSLPETPMGDVEELTARIDRLQQRKRDLESEVSDLQSIIGFNEDMLGEASAEVVDALGDGAGGDPTDQLVDSGTTTCWTCGSEVETAQIETTVDTLRDVRRETLSEVNDIEAELDDLQERRRDLQESQRRQGELDRRLSTLDEQIERSEAAIEELQDRKESMTEEVGSIEADIEGFEDGSYGEILDVHKEANQLEYELGKLEGDLDRTEAEIADVEAKLEEEASLTAERESLSAEIEDLRTRLDRLEKQSIDEFNEHMDEVLDLLDYRNLDRIWLERVEREVREGRKTRTKSRFTLHVIRTTDSGATYEDTVGHLSESERKVTGLIFALAGYLVHDVAEKVPFMLLDSMEAIDSERLATLVTYLDEHSPRLVVALLPEDAGALSDEYRYVREF